MLNVLLELTRTLDSKYNLGQNKVRNRSTPPPQFNDVLTLQRKRAINEGRGSLNFSSILSKSVDLELILVIKLLANERDFQNWPSELY